MSLLGWLACALAVPALLLLLVYGSGFFQLRRLRVRPRTSLRADPADVPTALRAVLDEGVATLTALGFTAAGYRQMPPMVDTQLPLATWFATARHTPTGALGAVMLSETPEPAWAWDVAFTSYLEDGSVIVTTDGRAHQLAPFREALALADDCSGDPAQAWSMHCARLQATGGAVTALDAAAGEAREQRLMIAMFEDAVARGRLLCDVDGRYRLSWRGALDFLRQLGQGQARRTRALAARGRTASGAAEPARLATVDAQVMAPSLLAAATGGLGRQTRLLVLAVTAALSWAALAWTTERAFASMLLLALAVHEGGHYLAMRRFGYENLKVFFVPFLGAAVAGDRAAAPAWQRAAIYLAGPLPGLLLGSALLGCLFIGWLPMSPWWWTFALVLVTLNYVNLLPLEPLDGGRLVSLLLFSRHPRARTAMYVVGLGGLALLAVVNGSLALGLFVVLVSLGLPGIHRQARLLATLRASAVSSEPRATIDALCSLVWAHYPTLAYPQRYNLVKDLLPDLRLPLPTHREALVGGVIYVLALLAPLVLASTLLGSDLLLVAVGITDASSLASPDR